jgi:7,8-dihydropterin-6-yl-methyl-4-(beta-D-ribofuranosyl)aminobenzene 5'-phosphate synthase
MDVSIDKTMKQVPVNEVDKVEILTLQDNYIEITAMDNSAVVTRATPLKAGEIRASILAEHGYSAIVKTTAGDRIRTMLFDFGFSEDGAAYNAETLGVDMKQVEAVALSHGHSDHMGGMERLTALIDKREIPLIVHPAVFKSPRYLKYGEELKVYFPKFTRERAAQAGLHVVESREPYPLLDGGLRRCPTSLSSTWRERHLRLRHRTIDSASGKLGDHDMTGFQGIRQHGKGVLVQHDANRAHRS